jgi:predicted nucleic acid-binding protein
LSEGRRRLRGRVLRERAPSSIVIDASIAVQWLTEEPGTPSAIRIRTADALLVAPDIMPIEVANSCWKKVRRGEMPADDAGPAVASLLSFGLELVPALALLPRGIRLALELGQPVYDSLYLALASERGARLATADERLRRAAERAGIRLWRA